MIRLIFRRNLMIIRDLKSEDFDAVNNIFMQLHNLHVEQRSDIYRKIEKQTTTNAWDYETSISDNTKIMIGAEIDGKIVGFGIIQIRQTTNAVKNPRVFAYFKNIAVDEKYRGKGIGTALYQDGIKRAKARDATSIELKVWSFNEEAIKFYKSLGMTVQQLTMEQEL